MASREHCNDNKIKAGKQVPRSSEYPAAVRDPGPVKISHFSAPLRSVKGANMASITHSASSWGEQWGNSALHPQGLMDHSPQISYESDAGRQEFSLLF